MAGRGARELGGRKAKGKENVQRLSLSLKKSRDCGKLSRVADGLPDSAPPSKQPRLVLEEQFNSGNTEADYTSMSIAFISSKSMFLSIGINGKTNHSLRASSATDTFHAGVPEKIIQKRTGHRSLKAL